jgi:hypothetical protein
VAGAFAVPAVTGAFAVAAVSAAGTAVAPAPTAAGQLIAVRSRDPALSLALAGAKVTELTTIAGRISEAVLDGVAALAPATPGRVKAARSRVLYEIMVVSPVANGESAVRRHDIGAAPMVRR